MQNDLQLHVQYFSEKLNVIPDMHFLFGIEFLQLKVVINMKKSFEWPSDVLNTVLSYIIISLQEKCLSILPDKLLRNGFQTCRISLGILNRTKTVRFWYLLSSVSSIKSMVSDLTSSKPQAPSTASLLQKKTNNHLCNFHYICLCP